MSTFKPAAGPGFSFLRHHSPSIHGIACSLPLQGQHEKIRNEGAAAQHQGTRIMGMRLSEALAMQRVVR